MNQQDLNAWMQNIIEFLSGPMGLWVGVGGSVLVLTLGVALARRSQKKPRDHQKPTSEAPSAPPPPQTAQQQQQQQQRELQAPALKLPREVSEIRALDQKSWSVRLRQGLSKTRTLFQQNLESVFGRGSRLDATTLEALHENLFRCDIGVATTDKLVAHVREAMQHSDTQDWQQVQQQLHSKSLELMSFPPPPLHTPEGGPLVILVVGVNGAGKTTTIGKLAAHYLAAGQSVLLCAADTYRAAAIDQLKVWGERLEVKVVAHQQGSDPAAVAYDAVKAAMARDYEVLIIDTAGRLHSKNDLMAELNKITRVIGKDLPGAPHETWLVVDATTGQNAFAQVKAFQEVVPLSGLVVTKLDGTAKGGVIIGICDQFKLPIRFIGVGEKAADLRPFSPQEFADSLFSSGN